MEKKKIVRSYLSTIKKITQCAKKSLSQKKVCWGGRRNGVTPPPPFRIIDNQPTRQCPNISSLFTAPHLKRFPGVEKFIELFLYRFKHC